MIARVIFECAVLVPGMGTCCDTFCAVDGWTLERLAPTHWKLSRKGDEALNVATVPPFIVDGYAAVYEEKADPPVKPLKKAKLPKEPITGVHTKTDGTEDLC